MPWYSSINTQQHKAKDFTQLLHSKLTKQSSWVQYNPKLSVRLLGSAGNLWLISSSMPWTDAKKMSC